jgi:pilus assembly protein Flp/PilA
VTDTSGVTSLEYALIGTLIAVVIITGVTAMGSSMTTLYTLVKTKIT